jgi:Helix-turn-helix domain
VGIGGALAGARSEAGLTVDQVSERTRIRATIIRAIERDDYAVCGGNFYARGHIRAIARVVGTDPAPLIEQYDMAQSPPPPPDDTSPHRGSGAWLHTLDGERDRGSHPVANGAAPTAAPTANGHSGNASVRPGGITAAEAFGPTLPLQFQGTRPLPVRRVLLTLIVLAVIAVVAYLLTAGGAPPAPARSHHPAAGRSRHNAAAAPGATATTAGPNPAPTALSIVSAAAFGPAGPSQGDNPSEAALAVDGSAGTAWHTDWYAAADLNGQPGTGLLLDMGTSVALSSVQVLLGPAPGGTVQLRAGNTPSLADLPVVAMAANPGGALTLRVSAPVTARYVLLWFTQLPPGNAGTYEAFVYNVSVSGAA